MRQPSIGRLIALAFSVTVILLLTIDTSLACRFFLRRHYSACPPVAYYPAPCEVVVDCCSGPVVTHHRVVYDNCCVDGQVVVEGPVVDETVKAPATKQPTPAAPDIDAVDNLSEVPEATKTPSPLPGDVDDTTTNLVPPAEESDQPTIVEEPDDIFPEPTPDAGTEELPGAELPGTEATPDDDIFATPPAETPPATPPADDAADSLFDEPATPPATELPAAQPPAAEPPATETPGTELPADTPPADDLDLFDTPADSAAEQPAPAEAPATEPPATEASAPGTPATDTPPADQEKPADDLDDLFGAASTPSEVEPRTAAREDMPADDLFGSQQPPVEQAAPAPSDVPSDDPIDAPAADGQQDDKPNNNVDDLDDLFGAQQAKPAAAQPEATKAVAVEPDKVLESRLWTDNTGHFQTRGRLVKVSATHVRLFKENGRYSTVPKRRLSEADLKYVEEVTPQLGIENIDQVAQR
jgi:hypothetical protein